MIFCCRILSYEINILYISRVWHHSSLYHQQIRSLIWPQRLAFLGPVDEASSPGSPAQPQVIKYKTTTAVYPGYIKICC